MIRSLAFGSLAIGAIVAASLLLFWGFIRADDALETLGCMALAGVLGYLGMWAWDAK